MTPDRPPRKLPSGMTKADLVDVVYDRHGGLTKNEAAEIVEAIFKTVKTSLREGRTVRIKNFGTFEITNRPGRSGVNPVSGERIFIPPHRGLSFRPARRLKDVPGNDRSAGPEHAAGSASSAGSSRPAISARAERD